MQSELNGIKRVWYILRHSVWSAWGGSSVPHTYCPLYSNVIRFVPSIYANIGDGLLLGLPPYCILFVFYSSVHFMLAGFKTPPTSSFCKAGSQSTRDFWDWSDLSLELYRLPFFLTSAAMKNTKVGRQWPQSTIDFTPKHLPEFDQAPRSAPRSANNGNGQCHFLGPCIVQGYSPCGLTGLWWMIKQ